MSALTRRIGKAGTNTAAVTGTYHPYGTAATPMTMPLAGITWLPVQDYPFGTLLYESLHPVWSPDGAQYQVASRDNSPPIRVVPAGRP